MTLVKNLSHFARKAHDMLRTQPWYDKHDAKANVTDALTNLRHYCDAQGIDFHAASDSSYQHYLTERRP